MSNIKIADGRQSPSSHGGNHPNGVNGAMGFPGGLGNYPTPVGHQSDLTLVMSMVEELSQVLLTNQTLTAGVIERMGKVGEKARQMNLSNDDVVAAVGSEMHEHSKNTEKENFELRRALAIAEADKKENWNLAVRSANVLADITEKMHRFKEQHELETLTWHRNYRKQLAAEREENLNLRCQISEMKAAAGRANEHLRDINRYIAENDEWNELRIQNNALRLEKRYWKRLALPLIPDDDSEWSDDSDLIDPKEKMRLDNIEFEKRRAEWTDLQ
ncbi:hypothetical protein K3495_g3025 [Podosphaera aphanis]|nr:hypothetical protein K3495_g3025 [Podosphaera aphanis]